MKKILALVLALVMTMSLATISSGAAYSDADKVQYTDAVNAMSALGVMGGYADGSIRPQADVTRGAAAKMVAMVATGSNATTIGYYKGTTAFSDVPAGHTFADAVAYCVARGIVAGYGDGTYGVGDNVKGWAVAKMVLVAMGYDAKAFGMEGAGSALNTITLASQKGLFAGMAADFDATAAASREECAQIVYNALTKTGVAKGSVNSDGSYTYVGSGATLLDNYKVVVGADAEGEPVYASYQYGVVVENTATGAAATTLDDGTLLTNETGLDMIGHKVMYVDTKAALVDGAKTAFAVVDLSTAVVTVAAAADVDTAKEFKAAFGYDTLVTDSGKATVAEFANYDAAASTSTVAYAKSVVDGVATYTMAAGTYVMVDDAIVSYMAPDSFEVGYVSDYTAVKGTTDGSLDVAGDSNAAWTLPADEAADVNFYADIAEDDVVVVMQTGDIFTVSKADTVTGVVSAIDSANYTITIGGKTYYESYEKISAVGSIMPAAGSIEIVDWAAAMTYNVVAYLDASGAVFALTSVVEEAGADAGLVYLTGMYSVAGAANAYGEAAETAYYVQAVDMSGKEVSYQVEPATVNADGTFTVANYTVKTLTKVTLTTDEYGVTYATFDATEPVDGSWKLGTGAIDASLIKVGSDYFASDVKTIYVKVGASLADLKVEVKNGTYDAAASKYYAVANGNNYDVKYIVVDGEYTVGAVESTDVVYAVADAEAGVPVSTKSVTYTKADGTLGVADVYSVYVNGVLTEVKVAANTANVAPATGFNTYKVDALGLYDFDAMTEGNVYTGTVTNLYGDLLTVDGTDPDLTDVNAKGAKIVDLAAAADDTLTATSTLAGLVKSDEVGATGASVAVVYDVDANNVKTIVTIYVIAQAS